MSLHKQLYVQTPLIEETRPVFPRKQISYKMEAFQPSGSFKLRGIELACRRALDKGAKKLLSSSGGNAGLAVAYVGSQWSVPVTVVLPESTPSSVADELKRLGSKVIIHGRAWDESNAYCLNLLKEDNRWAYIPPFDHPDLWEGHGSMVDELKEQCRSQPDCIILSVGGGGLMNGVVEGLKRNGWTDTAILAVETVGADSLYQSVQAGHIVTLDDITSVAKSLGAKRVADKTFENVQNYRILPHLVADREAEQACVRFADEHRVLVEPACGASLSPVYAKDPILEPYKNIVVIVCGGSKVDLAALDAWRN
jgi:L-serine/L-threonine ammonia-lyase